MEITIKEVGSRQELRKFVQFPNKLYRDNKYYVPQLVSADMAMLDPKKNHAFDVCEGKYFLAYNTKGKIVGRVAGIINHAYNEKVGEGICRFNCLDFIEDQSVLDALMGAVENYAREHGMAKMNGPVGFLEFDPAGVLVEGFDEYPTAYGKYNAPYYDPMLVSLGYVKDVDWVEYRVNLENYNPERDKRAASIIAQRFNLHQAPIHKRKDIRKYLDGMFEIMNQEYSKLHGYSPLTEGQLKDLEAQFISHLDPQFVSAILDENDKVIAFSVWIQSLAKALIKAKGHLFPFGFIHILRALKHNDTVDTLLVAIDEKYQKKGVSAMLISKMSEGFAKYGTKYVESTRELETNSNIQNIFFKYSPRQHKRARSYVKTL